MKSGSQMKNSFLSGSTLSS